jgi:hypothetical protein
MFERLSPNAIIAAALIAPPGADVITALAAVDPLALDDGVRVDLMVAWERQHAWVRGCGVRLIAAVGHAARQAAEPWNNGDDPPSEIGLRSAHAEIGAALRLPDNHAADRFDIAESLVSDLPAVHADLLAGEISYEHAAAFVDATRTLLADKARMVAGRLLPRARRQTVPQLRRCLRRAVIAADPEGAAERIGKAQADRKLDWWPLADGMAELRLKASAADVMAVFNAADAIARKLRADGPARGTDGWIPIDALRADALIHLIAGCDRPPAPVAVNVTIDLPTLLGLQDNPGELAGYGPLPAPLARLLAADGRWRRMIVEPRTGALIDLGHSSYQPSAELARFVKTRDRTCIFPTCNRAAKHCEIDHDRRYNPRNPEGGRTDRANLHTRCGNHHTLKHKAGWTPHADAAGGHTTWTSPLGRKYTVLPADHRSTTDLGPCPF